jgi:predicted aspartyl protease
MYKTVGGAGRCPALDIALVTLEGVELPVVTALVDSGADCSMFPVEWATRLGIDLDECDENACETAGGTVKSYVYRSGITAMIEGHKYQLAATFSEHLSVVLLGRDFFMYYRVVIDERAKCIVLEPYPRREWHDPDLRKR